MTGLTDKQHVIGSVVKASPAWHVSSKDRPTQNDLDYVWGRVVGSGRKHNNNNWLLTSTKLFV